MYLQQRLNAFVVPDPLVAPLLYASATLRNSPQRFWNWCGIIQVHFGVGLLDCRGCHFRLVVRNC